MFLVVMLITLFVLMIHLVSQLLFIEVSMLLMNLLDQYLKSINIAEKIMKDQFNKNLVMTEEEYLFQQSNNCWICKKIIDNEDKKLEIIVI